MEKDSAERIEELVRQKLDGKSYTEIQSKLKDSGLSPEEIKDLLRKVDEKVLEEAVKEGIPDKAGQWYKTGLVLAILGLLLTIASNLGVILKNFPPIAVYSPFIVGILLMFYAKKKQGLRPEENKEGTGAIRKKRPFK